MTSSRLDNLGLEQILDSTKVDALLQSKLAPLADAKGNSKVKDNRKGNPPFVLIREKKVRI